jgi:hypothetical protein
VLLVGTIVCLIFRGNRRLRRFALAALISPFVSSVVFLFGSWILADMSPCAEQAYSCVSPSGHAATRMDVGIWLFSVLTTLLLSTLICVKLQKVLGSNGMPR